MPGAAMFRQSGGPTAAQKKKAGGAFMAHYNKLMANRQGMGGRGMGAPGGGAAMPKPGGGAAMPKPGGGAPIKQPGGQEPVAGGMPERIDMGPTDGPEGRGIQVEGRPMKPPGGGTATPEGELAATQGPQNVARPTPGVEGPVAGGMPNQGPAVPRGVQDAGAGAGGRPMRPNLRNRFMQLGLQGRAPGMGGFGMQAPGGIGGMRGPGGRQMIQQYMRNRRQMPGFRGQQMGRAPKRRGYGNFFTGGAFR